MAILAGWFNLGEVRVKIGPDARRVNPMLMRDPDDPIFSNDVDGISREPERDSKSSTLPAGDEADHRIAGTECNGETCQLVVRWLQMDSHHVSLLTASESSSSLSAPPKSRL